MGIWTARFWVFVALLSLVMELGQGPRPMRSWCDGSVVSRAGDRAAHHSTETTEAVTEAEEQAEADSPDGTPEPGEDSDERPDEEPGEKSGEKSGEKFGEKSGEKSGEQAEEEDTEELGKKTLDPVHMAVTTYAFVGLISGRLKQFRHIAELIDLTHHEAPERPPRPV